MKMTRRKTYLALLGLGGAALVVDRLLLTTPLAEPWETLAAETPDGESAPRDVGVPQVVTPQGIPELPFPGGLSAIGLDGLIHDLFAPPSRRADTKAAARPAGASCAPHGVPAHKAFADSHRLDAILEEGDVHIAVVGGELLKPGGKIAGCVLRRLEGTKAYFSCEDGEAVLELSASAEIP